MMMGFPSESGFCQGQWLAHYGCIYKCNILLLESVLFVDASSLTIFHLLNLMVAFDTVKHNALVLQ